VLRDHKAGVTGPAQLTRSAEKCLQQLDSILYLLNINNKNIGTVFCTSLAFCIIFPVIYFYCSLQRLFICGRSEILKTWAFPILFDD
jgi:hypothetical protein